MKLWMKLSRNAFEELSRSGKLKTEQPGDFSEVKERDAHDFLGNQLRQCVKSPANTFRYPLLAWYQKDGKKHLREYLLQNADSDCVILTLEVPREQFQLFDERLFCYVKRAYYIPENEGDLQRHELVMEKMNLNYEKLSGKDDVSLAVQCVKRVIEASWQRIFDLKREDGYIYGMNSRKSIQAALWEIKIEQIRKVEMVCLSDLTLDRGA